MWFIPSYGRPESLQKLRKAPGGLPPANETVIVLTADDPSYAKYDLTGFEGSTVLTAPAGSKLCDLLRFMSNERGYANQATYGVLNDDMEPQSVGWWKELDEAAYPRFVAISDCPPRGLSIVGGCYVLGGDLVRAMGSLQPCEGLRHSYADNVIHDLAKDFDLGRGVPSAKVLHRHVAFGLAPHDATYARGQETLEADAKVYKAWAEGRFKSELYAKVSSSLGIHLSLIDPSAIKLCLAVPIQGGNVDVGFHRSLLSTLHLLRARGLAVSLCESGLNSHIGKGRETVLWNAMREGATHILFIDSDMTWDPELVLRLLAASEVHPFCGAVGRKKESELKFCLNALPNPQRFDPRTGFLEVKEVGFAFVMLKKEVIDQLCAAHPELRYNSGRGPEWALFLDLLDKSDTEAGPFGERLSEDLSFCRRWRAIGGSVWLDPDATLGHAGRHEFVGTLREVLELAEPAPALLAAE